MAFNPFWDLSENDLNKICEKVTKIFQSLLGFIKRRKAYRERRRKGLLSIPFGIYLRRPIALILFLIHNFQSLLGFILLSISSLSTQSQNSFQSLLGFIKFSLLDCAFSELIFQSLLGFIMMSKTLYDSRDYYHFQSLLGFIILVCSTAVQRWALSIPFGIYLGQTDELIAKDNIFFQSLLGFISTATAYWFESTVKTFNPFWDLSDILVKRR